MLVGAAACEDELEAPDDEESEVELELEPPEVAEAVSDDDESVEVGAAE